MGQVGVRMGVQVGSDEAGDVGSIGVTGFDGRTLGSARFIDCEMETLASTGFGVTAVGSIGAMVFGVMMVGVGRVAEDSVGGISDAIEVIVGSTGTAVSPEEDNPGPSRVIVGSGEDTIGTIPVKDGAKLGEPVSTEAGQSKHATS